MTANDTSTGRTTIAVAAIANCAFSIADDYAAEFLRAAERGGPEATIAAPWPFPSPAPHHRVALSFGLHLDMVDGGRQHDEVRLHWKSRSVLLPDFHGTLRFGIADRRTNVFLDGSYISPLGPAGRIFDRLIGARIAKASLQDLVNRIAGYLGERELAWRRTQTALDATTPTIPAAPGVMGRG